MTDTPTLDTTIAAYLAACEQTRPDGRAYGLEKIAMLRHRLAPQQLEQALTLATANMAATASADVPDTTLDAVTLAEAVELVQAEQPSLDAEAISTRVADWPADSGPLVSAGAEEIAAWVLAQEV